MTLDNKIIVKLYVPKIEEQYDVSIPLNKQIYTIIELLVKAVNELCGGYYKPSKLPMLYDKITAKAFDVNLTVIETTLRNGSEIVLF